MLSLVLLVASVGSAATSGAAALERTCVARISGPVAQALRERRVIERRIAVVDYEVVETPRLLVAGDLRAPVAGDTPLAWWMLDLPPPSVL